MATEYQNILNSCCICLCLNASSRELKTFSEDKSLITKLKTCFSEIDWLESYFICQSCIEQLEIVHNFRVLCLQSHEIRQKLARECELLRSSFDNFLLNENCDENLEPCKTETEHSPETEDTFTDNIDTNVCSDENDPFISEKPKIIRAKRTSNFTCDICGSTFKTSKKLIEHSVTEHNINKKEVKPFTCPKCPNKFSRSSNLHQHMKYHEGSRNHMCAYCGKGFIAKCDLAIHEKQHLNKREYKCSFCPKSFNTHKDLRSHKLVVHTDPSLWTYVCSICSKRFPIKSNYDSHMRRHNNDKPFVCHICEKKFSDKCVLQKHMRSHSEVRAFKCKECHKEYKDKRVMELHMAKIHHLGEIKIPEKVKKYFCHMCPKSYFIKSRLTRHLYAHSGERPFMCSFCDKKFSDKSYVRIHMKSAHNFVQEAL